MNIYDKKYYYFIGIGGIGMSALARYFRKLGKHVSGYDRTRSSLTDAMTAEGISIHFDESINAIPDIYKENIEHVFAIYTPAIPSDNEELRFFTEKGYLVAKRAEVLGEITRNAYTIAVAGTHGKTTVSAMITHILRTARIECTSFLGGISSNYNTNMLHTSGIAVCSDDVVIAEADEYDRSFLRIHPDIAVITAVDADHLDIYGTQEEMESAYCKFANLVDENGYLILNRDIHLDHGRNHITSAEHQPREIYYSFNMKADFYVKNLSINGGRYVFDIQTKKETIKDITLAMPGRHNVENAVVAVAVASVMNISAVDIRTALADFTGVKRRFERHIESKELIYIDDYAHHPREISACISSVRELYPGKKITAIFQPHLFSRTRDLADDFAGSLSASDNVILLDIYPAREKPIAGVSSQMLLEKITLKNKKILSEDGLLQTLKMNKPEILLTLGAGDIDALAEPIKKILTG